MASGKRKCAVIDWLASSAGIPPVPRAVCGGMPAASLTQLVEPMLDLVFVGVTVAVFAVLALIAKGVEKL